MLDLNGVKAFLFDVDMTLLDNGEAHRRAYVKLLESIHIGDIEERLGRLSAGLTSEQNARRLVADKFPNSDFRALAARKHDFYVRSFSRNARACEGSIELVKLLKERGYRIGLFSGGIRADLEKFLVKAGFDMSWFGAFATIEPGKRGKPFPDLVLEACRRLGVEPAETLVVGDSTNDAEPARAAGCFGFIGVTTGWNSRAELEKDALAVYGSLQELVDELSPAS